MSSGKSDCENVSHLSTASLEDETSVAESIISLDTTDESIICDSCTDFSYVSPDSLHQIIEESVIESSLESEGTNSTSQELSPVNKSDIEYIGSFTKGIPSEITGLNSSAVKEKSSLEVSDIGESIHSHDESAQEIEDCDVVLSTPERAGIEKIGSIQSALERSTLERQIRDKTITYQNILKAVRCCDMKKLKDGGKLLKQNLIRCRQELDDLEEKLKDVIKEESDFSENLVAEEVSSISSLDCRHVNKVENDKYGITPQWLTFDAVVTIHESLMTRPNAQRYEDEPNGLKVGLMPHQKHALAWLLWREKQTPSGGILADDMGLGKTLSVIALILRSKELEIRDSTGETNEEKDSIEIVGQNVRKGKTLVVCEASLIGQWESQIKSYCESSVLSVHVHHGKTRLLEEAILATYDIVITTYGLIIEENKCRKDGRKGPLYRVNWERVVLDEAHVIRNCKTQKAVAACELLGLHRWCLTGTPIQNKELDLYSLLKFLRCAPFDDRSVWKRWVDNKSVNGVKRLKALMTAILLRRTKEELKTQGVLKDLPNKNVIPVYVELDEDESKVYHEVLKFSKSFLAEYLRQKESAARPGEIAVRLGNVKSKDVRDIQTTEIFVLLLRLRQICCLPGLIHALLEKDVDVEGGIESDCSVVEDLNIQLSRMSISHPKTFQEDSTCENILLKSNPVFEMSRVSSKINTLLNIIDELLTTTNDKIIIVSQWTNLLKHLKQHLQRLDVGIVIFDGTVPVKFRPKIIEDFNNTKSEVRIMLLSLSAGGVGLNLLGGNRLVIFEPHWNPQLESQACDRIYRIGQRKEVFVYKIICKDTVEERIAALQKEKLDTADNILHDIDSSHHSKLQHLTLRDLISLFDV